MSKNLRRALSLFIALSVLLTLALTGCGQNAAESTKETTGSQQASQEETKKVEDPYEFSIFRATWTELNDETDLVIGELNKKLNVKIKVLTSPYETWVDKYNVLMSSGETPDLSVVSGPGYYGYDQWVEQGKFLDITDMYKNYPNIVKWIPQTAFDAIKLKGKAYCVPKPYLYEDALVFRMDWMKKLNLSLPTTLDELYTVLKAFSEQDPDGNGKADTFGFLTDDSMYNFMYFFGAFGTYGTPYDGYQWYRKADGTVDATLLQPGTKDAVKYLANLYSEKIIDSEWMITKSQALLDKFKAGKGGCINTGISQMYAMEADMQKADPNITLDAVTKIAGADGKFGKDVMGTYYMTCSISADAKNPDKILGFLDYLLTDEGVDLLIYGVEGVSYTKENGKIVMKEGADKEYGLIGGHKFTWMMGRADWSFPKDERGNKYRGICKWFMDQQPALPPVTLPSQTEIISKQGADMISKELVAMIIGKKDVDKEWDNMINKWKETGADQLIKEVNEAIANK